MSSFVRIMMGGLILSLAAISGCRGDRSAENPRQFFPGMDDQPRYDPQEQSEFFADGRAAREPVANTVAFGQFGRLDLSRPDYLRDSDTLYRGRDASGNYLDRAPIRELLENGQSVTDLIQQGQTQFNIYCIVCHGGLAIGGQGTQYAGMVGNRWSYPLPNLHDPQYQRGGEKGQDGYIFNVIRNGVPNQPGVEPPLRMPSYAQQLREREAWAVVLYLRTLQRSRHSSINDVPEAARASLLAAQEETP